MSKRRQRPETHEEHGGDERWLLTYADMITLLMVLFIVLFAIGQTDLAKFQAFRHSLATAFGGPAKPNPVVNGGSGARSYITGIEIKTETRHPAYLRTKDGAKAGEIRTRSCRGNKVSNL